MMIRDTRDGDPAIDLPAGVTAGFEHLATAAREGAHGEIDTLVAAILELIAASLDAGLTFLSRVDGPALHVERAHDRAGMGLHSGDVAPLCDTY